MRSAGSSEGRWFMPLLLCTCVSMSLLFFSRYSIAPAGGRGDGDGPGGMLRESWAEGSVVEGGGTSPSQLPVFAYLITGSKGDGDRMKRLLMAIYHPRNEYLLHMDLEAPPRERVDLARFLRSKNVFTEMGNVHMVARSNLVTYRGPTMIAAYLHCLAILLRQRRDWDWFINLSASDYPLVTQDDLSHVFSFLPRDLNFLEHDSALGWKEYQRARPIVIDPAIYSTKKLDLFFTSQRRTMPTSFKLYQGEAWVVLSRSFSEYTIWGWDNLPRLALMYFVNYVSSPEGYFHTVICNSREFKNTTVNNDLRYIRWDKPAPQHPKTLTSANFQNFTESGEPFARKFDKNSAVLDKIDKELLNRRPNYFTPGGWCIGPENGLNDPCEVRGDSTVLRPTMGTKRLQANLLASLEPTYFRSHQCA